jgi:hypothetical protein
MDACEHQNTGAGEHLAPPPPAEQPTLEQLICSTRELYADTAAQFRDVGELAFMELELAIKSLQWGVWAVLLFGASSVMAFSFLVLAMTILLMENTVSPALASLLIGGFCGGTACLLYLWLRSLARKMTFQNLRRHLTQQRDR